MYFNHEPVLCSALVFTYLADIKGNQNKAYVITVFWCTFPGKHLFLLLFLCTSLLTLIVSNVLKTFTLKEKKNHYHFLSLLSLPRTLKKAHRFVCLFDRFSTHVLHVPRDACVSKPFYLLLYLCTKLCECKATSAAAAREQAKMSKNNNIFYKLYCFSWEGDIFLYSYLFSMVKYQLLSLLRHRSTKKSTFLSQPLQD